MFFINGERVSNPTDFDGLAKMVDERLANQDLLGIRMSSPTHLLDVLGFFLWRRDHIVLGRRSGF